MKDRQVHWSLVWLVLHEIQHFDLNHFDILERPAIAEAALVDEFGVVSRGRPKPAWLLDLSPVDQHKVEPCLEMQADHEAIELLLDAYGPEGWPLIRQRAAAISTMMVLIEREDAARGYRHSSHPRAATRIFQLLGHLVDMPSLPALFKAEAKGSTKIDPDDCKRCADHTVLE